MGEREEKGDRQIKTRQGRQRGESGQIDKDKAWEERERGRMGYIDKDKA